MTTLPRAATAPELAKLRSDNQSTRYYLTVHSPATVYTARLDTVPTSTDKVASITYTSGSGTLANVLQDQTLLVGSVAGGSDYGIARIRKAGTTTAGTFYIGETSEINWVSNAYLTVIDEFTLWPRHIRIDPTDGTTPLMDYDVVYTNQNETAGAIPTPIMGPHAVVWYRGSNVTYTPDASASWTKDGTITGYAWVCTGASVANGTTATPTITFSSVGTYRLELTVTNNSGTSFTGYRYVFVVNESSGVTTQFTLDNCEGSMSGGGWSFGVTCYAEATLALVRDRALCILHSVDYYGNTQGSIGYMAGSENIVALGWIAGDSITRGTDDKWGTVSFDVRGPQYWLGNMTAFPSGVKDVSDATTPNKWTKFRGLTLNKALYHFMRWRCTATRCMDVYPSADTRRHKRLESPGGQNIWAQLVEIAQRSILANPCCDRYGRFFCEIDQQLVSDRSSMPIVQAITTQDVAGDIRIERTPTDSNSLIDLSGISWDGATATPFFSLAPGHVFGHYGSTEVVDRLMLTDQNTTNTLAGLVSAWRNNNYKTIDITFAAHHRLFDVTPYQRLTLALSADDTPRGITESLTLIPRSISLNHNQQAGYTLTNATFEAEVIADLAITGDTPQAPPDPPITPVDPPIVPPVNPPLPADAKEVWLLASGGTNGVKILFSGDFFNGGQPSWNVVNAPANYTISFSNYNSTLAVTLDGAAVYLGGRDGSHSNRPTIWKLDNVAAIRADPLHVSASWSVLVYDQQTVSYGTVTYCSTTNPFPMQCVGSNLYCLQRKDEDNKPYYCVYDGSAWAYTQVGAADASVGAVHRNAILFNDTIAVNYLTNSAGTLYGTNWDTVNGNPTVYDVWGLYNSSANFWVAYEKTGGTKYYLRHVNSSTDFDTTITATSKYWFGGAQGGVYCYVHDDSGHLWITSSGAAFTLLETFTTGTGGRVWDAKLAGNGALVRSQISTLSGNTAIFINSTRAIGAWSAMNGDMDTVYPRVGNLTFYGMNLVWL